MATDRVRIFEVGPRDGLQNEKRPLSLKDKIEFVESLVRAGIQDFELGAFVRPDRVPQMAYTDQIYEMIRNHDVKIGKSRPWCLVPNQKGLERALRVGAKRIAVFTAVTETFNKKNMGMTVAEGLREIGALIQTARAEIGPKLEVRGYISTAFGCPFEGRVTPAQALRVVDKLVRLGVGQVSIGDTIGVATPANIKALVGPAIRAHSVKMIAVHLHDTRGTALANALQSLELGVRIIDSSAGGFGGCPFAPGASGNLATEDLVYMLNGMKIKTGIDLDLLCRASIKMSKKMKRPLTSRYLQAYAAKKKHFME